MENPEVICRICLSDQSTLQALFGASEIDPATQKLLVSIITDVVQLELREGDGLPESICQQCIDTLLDIWNRLEQLRENNRLLRERIEVKMEPEPLVDDPGGVGKSLGHPSNHAKDEDPIGTNPPFENVELKDYSNEGNVLSTPVECLKIKIDVENSDESSSVETKRRKPKTEKILRKRGRKKKIDTHKRAPVENSKSNKHKCYICRSEPLGSDKALLEHLTNHLDKTPYTCTECKMETIVLKSVRSLNWHLKMHAQPVKCEYCDRRYGDERARDHHVKTFHLGESAPCPSTCEQCGKVCSSLSSLKTHMRDHRLDLKCEFCDKIFHRKYRLREHVAQVHENAGKYKCEICGKVVKSVTSYNLHLKLHTQEKTYECDLCPQKFYSSGNLNVHKKLHSSNTNYKPNKDWSQYYTVHQEPGQNKTYTCKICSKPYSSTVINSHLKLHFKEILCDQCDLKFPNQSQLKKHYVVHTGERQFKCTFCSKDFLHKGNLRQHLKLHRNEQNFACEFCGKLFTYKEGMKSHIRNHHLKESPYECSYCEGKFVDNASLGRHIVAEHEPAPVPAVQLGPPPLKGTVKVGIAVTRE
ncbi:zinc finger protein 726-like [Uranotaenia lowii]|uniref:zinc finger protein 726-like n=1 Tax=Uranotaenia lowii TaxID=190385 RepID=UPI002479CEB1|nr:zinc finger protein 726-like [Uranotaenia lowii]